MRRPRPSRPSSPVCRPTPSPKGWPAAAEPLEGRVLLSRAGWAPASTAGTSNLSAGGLTLASGTVTRPTLQLAPAGSNATAPLAVTLPGFQIEVSFPDSSLTASQQAAFTTAAAKWQSIITGDIPDVAASSSRWGAAVDDLRITATGVAIDGVGSVLGQAGPDYLRSGLTGANAQYNGLPISGTMEFDTADLASLESSGQLVDTITHEMGHVLGLGTLWSNKGLITGSGGADPQYTGANALAQYKTIFGTGGDTIPVENTGGAGTRDGHWREATFNRELMTGFLNSGTNPLSRVTAAQMTDLGYSGVVLTAADAYTPPSNAVPQVGTFTDSADPVPAGTAITLTATGLTNGGSAEAVTVKFYRDTNGVAGLQTVASGSTAADTLLVADTASPYTTTASTTGLSAGTYTYYAQPTDAVGLTGNAVPTTNTVQVVSAAPAAPDLVTASDTGTSGTDNRTARNNGSAGQTLQFAVANTVAGATVTVYADGEAVGSAVATGTTTTVTTNGTTVLPDGARSITARQTESGKTQSIDSAALSVTVDTSAPSAAVTAVTPDPRGTPVPAVTFTFTEAVAGFDLSDLALTRDGGANLLPGSGAALSSADGGVTWSASGLTSLTTTPGTYALSLAAAGSGVTDTAGNALAAGATDTFTVLPPLAVQSVQVNDGNAQRSRVTSLTVTFNQPVTLDAGAVTVVGRDGAGAGTVATLANPSSDGRTYVLTFSGSPVVAGSLADGVYDLRVSAAAAHAAAAGVAGLSADYGFAFHRLYSDADGDGDSDNFDLLQLRPTLLKPSTDPAYKAYFDYDGSGTVDNLDVFQVRSRRAVVFQGY